MFLNVRFFFHKVKQESRSFLVIPHFVQVMLWLDWNLIFWKCSQAYRGKLYVQQQNDFWNVLFKAKGGLYIKDAAAQNITTTLKKGEIQPITA